MNGNEGTSSILESDLKLSERKPNTIEQEENELNNHDFMNNCDNQGGENEALSEQNEQEENEIEEEENNANHNKDEKQQLVEKHGDSQQDISFEQNFSQENKPTIEKKSIDINDQDLESQSESNIQSMVVNTRQKNPIGTTNTIGEVSNENVSSFSNKEENSFVNKVVSEEMAFDTVDRSAKNLESLDFIVIANKSIQHIHHINYSFNMIKQMDNSLFYLGYVMTIDLSNNDIKKIQNLDNCLNLKYLNLSHNQIQFIEGIYHLHHLEVLDLSFNKIAIGEIVIKKLKFNKMLKSLNLDGNPNYNFEELKYKILDNIESVCVLDNKEIFKTRSKLKAKSNSEFKIFFKSGGKQEISDRPHNLKTIKDYIRFKKYFYQEEEKIKTKQEN
jgi:hypothetical protein